MYIFLKYQIHKVSTKPLNTNAQEMRRPETSLGCGQPPLNPSNQDLSVPCRTMSAGAKQRRRSGGTHGV